MLKIKTLIISLSFLTISSAVIANEVNVDKYAHFDKSTKIKQLTPLEYKVTQKGGTEPPFHNTYWNNEKPGIYVDIVSGEPLFDSTDKYDSGSGWPAFTKPIDDHFVALKKNTFFFRKTIEVRSRYADSHLGDLFDDGPPPSGKRYCIDSAALRFIPVSELDKEGYGQYLYLFKDKKALSVGGKS